VTGSDTFQQMYERALSHEEHPLDSLASHIPVLSEWAPFSWISAFDPDPDSLYGNWMRDRHVFLAYNATADVVGPTYSVNTPGVFSRRRMLHVTLDHDPAKRAERIRQQGHSEQGWFHDYPKWFEEQTAKAQHDRDPHPSTDDGEEHHRHDARVINDVTQPVLFATKVGSHATTPTKNHINDPNTLPSIAVVHLVSTRDCVIRPGEKNARNPLCLSEIPAQLICFLEYFVHWIFVDTFTTLKFCGFEHQCSRLGFAIIKRPPFSLSFLVPVKHVSLFISWPWIQNGFVWFAVAGSIVLPILRELCDVVIANVPPLKAPAKLLKSIIPTILTFQDSVCLTIFFYGAVLLILLIWIFWIFYPLVTWTFRTLISLASLVMGLMAVEAQRYAAIQQSSWYQMQQITFNGNPSAYLREDPFVVSSPIGSSRIFSSSEGLPPMHMLTKPFVATPVQIQRRISAHIGAPVGSLALDETRLTDDIDTAPAPVSVHDELTPEQRYATMRLFSGLRKSKSFWGEADPSITVRVANEFEGGLKPFQLSFHASGIWLSRYIAETEHKTQKYWTRRPAVAHVSNGMLGRIAARVW
jgi:hypothetical protein